jgi:hypothetical protein
MTLLSAGADESSFRPLQFGCEVRYHFRERLQDTKAYGKKFSAPSYEREALPVPHVVNSSGSTAQLVKGRVPHLPYRFQVQIVQNSGTEPGTLEVNIADNSGRSLAGFPQTMPNPLTRSGETSRKAFGIPIGQGLKKKIERTLLIKGQVLTHVDLIIGADEDFLSADFPK